MVVRCRPRRLHCRIRLFLGMKTAARYQAEDGWQAGTWAVARITSGRCWTATGTASEALQSHIYQSQKEKIHQHSKHWLHN